MSRVIVLDTGVLGLLAHPQDTPESLVCRQWMQTLLDAGEVVVLPEMADYELRRELLRRRARQSLRRLDALQLQIYYVPLTTITMQQAAAFWAEARQQGHKSAPDAALDGDVILAAQASLLTDLGEEIVVATTNVKHLAPFIAARLWQDI